MKNVLALFLIIAGGNIFGQSISIPDELFGFRLGQYKTVISNEMGTPSITQVSEDSTIVDFYYLSQDSLTYLAFQFLPENPNEIYAIQISGIKSNRLFYGIQLGEDKLEIVKIFGNPETILNQSFKGKNVDVWKYINKNLSFIIHEDKLESIRIWNDEIQESFTPPTLEEIFEVLNSNDNQKICNILSPNLEINYCGKIIAWKNSFFKDVYVEKASLFEFISNNQYGLKSIASKKELKSDYNLRYVENVGTFPVYKFPEESLISEIVLNFQQGRYKIWEINYKCD